VTEALERRLAAARERVRELSRNLTGDVLAELLAAYEQRLQAERDLAAARGEQYAQVIDIGPDWDGTYVTMVSPADQHSSIFVVLELWGCQEIRFGGPNDEAIAGHPLHGRGLAGYRAHEVLSSEWIEEAIRVNSVHPHHSGAPFRQLHHYALLFHDEMVEALARGIESRLVT